MQQPIYLPAESATSRSGLPAALREAIRKHRSDALSALRQVPSFVSAVRKTADNGNCYRVLVSKANAHRLKEGADGITSAVLRNEKGRIVEHAGLVRVPPDVAGSLATVAIQATLTELSVKLDTVIQGVDSLSEIIRNANVGSLQGAIDSLEVARRLRDEPTRRTQMLIACGQILGEIGTVIGQMKAHIADMPLPKTGFWTGWSGDGVEKAGKKWKAVHEDFAVIAEGLRRVIDAYCELGEFEAAQEAFSRICERLIAADLEAAGERARLLPYPKQQEGTAPELVFESFRAAIPLAKERLQLLASGAVPEIEFEFKAEEFLQ